MVCQRSYRPQVETHYSRTIGSNKSFQAASGMALYHSNEKVAPVSERLMMLCIIWPPTNSRAQHQATNYTSKPISHILSGSGPPLDPTEATARPGATGPEDVPATGTPSWIQVRTRKLSEKGYSRLPVKGKCKNCISTIKKLLPLTLTLPLTLPPPLPQA